MSPHMPWKPIIAHLLEHHPHAEPVDLYKLIHQATLGIGHLISDEHDARQKLADEARGLDLTPRDWEEVVEVIRPAEDLVRIHLRPYLRAGGSLDRILEAMLRTQALMGAVDLDVLAQHLGAARLALHELDQDHRFDRRGFDVLLRDLAAEGFPVRSHSDAYRELYDPHYRVVLLETLQSGSVTSA